MRRTLIASVSAVVGLAALPAADGNTVARTGTLRAVYLARNLVQRVGAIDSETRIELRRGSLNPARSAQPIVNGSCGHSDD